MNQLVVSWKKIEEIKGVGMRGEDGEGNVYQLGINNLDKANNHQNTHTAYLIKNNSEIGWVDMDDEIREESKKVISYLHSKNIKTILLFVEQFCYFHRPSHLGKDSSRR